jgi:putative ABC transport system permease protein
MYAKANCLLWSMNNWHLRTHFSSGKPDGGLITVVHIVSVIGWIILLIACINFMNLSTARAGHRAREVGVRKTLGAMRKGLIGQFLLESLFMSFAAVVLAILLVYPALPGFNMLVGKELTFSPFTPVHFAALMFIGFFCGVIAGSYPAFYLSSFDPVAVLKGQLGGSRAGLGAGLIRKGLVVTQFTFSVGLIVCTVITNQQLQYLRSRDLGYNKEHLLYAPIEGDLANHFEALKTGLLQSGVVASAAISHSPPLEVWSSGTSEQITWAGASPDKKVQINWEWSSPEYLSTMGLQVKEGRDFYGDVKSDSGDAIINETLAAIMGKDGHIGGYLTYVHRDRYRIIGIVKDYMFNDMRSNVTPLLLTCEHVVRGNYEYLEIRLRSDNNLPASMTKVEAIVKTINPGYPFDYHFVDAEFDHIFTIETRAGQFASIFSLLAILISCLGLFGLAAYTTECRRKEIGIRKVLGASVAGLAALLSKDFLQLVAVACLIAFPLAWGFTNYWLKDFAYHTAVHWWIFALAGTAAFIIALLTVSSLAIKAALMNPVETLRAE